MTYIFLIAAIIKQIFNLIAELIIPIGIPTKEAKADIKTYQTYLVFVEPKWQSV